MSIHTHVLRSIFIKPKPCCVGASLYMVQGSTLYQWPASASSPFVAPPVTAIDTIDSVNVEVRQEIFQCMLPQGGLAKVVLGRGEHDDWVKV